MIILDTNVISEVIRETPEPRVVAWLDRQPRSEIFTTSISKAKMLSGVTELDPGRRREQLGKLIRRIFETQFDSSLLAFDGAAAEQFAEIIEMRRRSGRPIKTMDALIAAIARSHGASVATRDVGGFDHIGLDIINPWEA